MARVGELERGAGQAERAALEQVWDCFRVRVQIQIVFAVSDSNNINVFMTAAELKRSWDFARALLMFKQFL